MQEAYAAGDLCKDAVTARVRAWVAHVAHGDTRRLREQIFEAAVFKRVERKTLASSVPVWNPASVTVLKSQPGARRMTASMIRRSRSLSAWNLIFIVTFPAAPYRACVRSRSLRSRIFARPQFFGSLDEFRMIRQ